MLETKQKIIHELVEQTLRGNIKWSKQKVRSFFGINTKTAKYKNYNFKLEVFYKKDIFLVISQSNMNHVVISNMFKTDIWSLWRATGEKIPVLVKDINFEDMLADLSK